MKKIKALTDFFWNGELILKNEILEADKEAVFQLVNEEKLCEVIKDLESNQKLERIGKTK